MRIRRFINKVVYQRSPLKAGEREKEYFSNLFHECCSINKRYVGLEQAGSALVGARISWIQIRMLRRYCSAQTQTRIGRLRKSPEVVLIPCR